MWYLPFLRNKMPIIKWNLTRYQPFFENGRCERDLYQAFGYEYWTENCLPNYLVSSWTIYKYKVNRTTSFSVTTGDLFIYAEAQLLTRIQAAVAAIVENKKEILYYDQASRYGRKTASIQMTPSKKFHAVGHFDEDIGIAERNLFGRNYWTLYC